VVVPGITGGMAAGLPGPLSRCPAELLLPVALSLRGKFPPRAPLPTVAVAAAVNASAGRRRPREVLQENSRCAAGGKFSSEERVREPARAELPFLPRGPPPLLPIDALELAPPPRWAPSETPRGPTAVAAPTGGRAAADAPAVAEAAVAVPKLFDRRKETGGVGLPLPHRSSPLNVLPGVSCCCRSCDAGDGGAGDAVPPGDSGVVSLRDRPSDAVTPGRAAALALTPAR